MITHLYVNTPCPCGAKHRLPVDPAGVVQWACGSARAVFTLRFNARQFQQLLATGPSEFAVADEGIAVVHQAGPWQDDQQRCQDCGFLLLSYRAFLRRFPTARQRIDPALVLDPNYTGPRPFWPVGALVGRTTTGAYYLASEPMSVHRERRCFMPARLM